MDEFPTPSSGQRPQPPAMLSIDDTALFLNEYYQSYLRVGFTDAQAFQLVKVILKEEVRASIYGVDEYEDEEDDDD